ncbi:hypothetical protein RISK_004567 [Rhodopirellula islandica]|uniref:Uncharacterized protein n=1 Tax=Rhodopirellula islandica TaxID=595434 RepID=A0A0J1B8V5_RHOIS|nr:hypothetical protein RISK_004567 [Rhodopirellula islandica]
MRPDFIEPATLSLFCWVSRRSNLSHIETILQAGGKVLPAGVFELHRAGDDGGRSWRTTLVVYQAPNQPTTESNPRDHHGHRKCTTYPR